MEKISNSDAWYYVRGKRAFLGNNLSADWSADGEYYAVFSYDNYPIYIYVDVIDTWYETSEPFSVTTKKHMTQARPQVTTVVNPDYMENVIHRGYKYIAEHRLTSGGN
jgi:hypothetical protein|tara:strand:+ start:1081 stop:1404 length:324 start_codon:yes stop_codon:yes gene_type:complete